MVQTPADWVVWFGPERPADRWIRRPTMPQKGVAARVKIRCLPAEALFSTHATSRLQYKKIVPTPRGRHVADSVV